MSESPLNDSPLNDAEMKLLTEVLAGDRRRDDADVVAASAQNPEFRVSLEELGALQGRLDGAGSGEQALIASALTGGDADRGMDDIVAGTIGRLAAGPAIVPGRATAMQTPGARGRRSPFVMWGVVGAAAAALLMVWALGGFGAGAGVEPNDDHRQLGDRELTLAASPNRQGGYDLAWTCTVPAESYEVTFYDPAHPTAQLPPGSGELEVLEWVIDRTTVEKLPKGVRWRVTAYLVGRSVTASLPLF